jgi:hypothetical protein
LEHFNYVRPDREPERRQRLAMRRLEHFHAQAKINQRFSAQAMEFTRFHKQ